MTAIYKEPVDEYISKNRKEIQIVIHFAKMTLVYVPPVQNYYYLIIPNSNGKIQLCACKNTFVKAHLWLRSPQHQSTGAM